jgi:hypothetical protein
MSAEAVGAQEVAISAPALYALNQREGVTANTAVTQRLKEGILQQCGRRRPLGRILVQQLLQHHLLLIVLIEFVLG